MKLSIATVSLSGGLLDKLEAIAAAGFKGVEIFENDLLSFNGAPADVRRLAADLGLEIITFQPFRDFEGMPADKRLRVLQRAERKFDLMHELGCQLLLVCSNVSPESLGGIDRAAADLNELGERAGKRGMRIGFEALAWGCHINDYRDAWEAVRRADHPAVGLVLDSFHTLARNTDLKPIRAIPRERIFLVQLADAPALDMDPLSWSRHFRNFPGQGDLPLLEFITALQATGFDGSLSLEIFNDQFRAGSTRSVAVDGYRSLLYLLDQLRARTGAATLGLPVLPPRSKCLGTEFIEFAIDESSAPTLEKVLRSLGFHRRGVHKSKAVTRWTQGAINVVVNTEKEGFAHSYNITHGASVCAIGLMVDDAMRTLERAQKLLDQPFRQAVGPGELEIPAVRGVGGSLLYFIDQKSDLTRVWEVEFEPTGEDGLQGAGLARVDHISQSMHYEEMLTWLLFYTSLLDVSKTPEQDVLDPGGLVKSQVVQSGDGALRIVLNASQSKHALSSRFLWEAFGFGVQHIAFATNDIFKTAERLQDNGLAFLAVPENYYDDLETKTDLPAEQIAALKAFNILYDRERRVLANLHANV
jgi:4-hydroxyphenylpyruvate dioxygenase